MRRSNTAALTLTAALLALAATTTQTGCLEDFDPPSKLDSLRVMALEAEPPEARPGELITVSALSFVPEDHTPPASGVADGQRAAYSWRACYLTGDLVESGAFGGSSSSLRFPVHCFELEQSMAVDDLMAGLAGGEEIDFSQVAIDLGSEPTAQLMAFGLPPFEALPSFCDQLTDEERAEQGGREFWVSGLRLVVTLQLRTAEETIYANKRIVMRPDAQSIPDDQQGLPFRTPRLCEEDAAGDPSPCARNVNPAAPVIETPNGEWSGDGPLVVAPGEQVLLLPGLPSDEDLQPYVALKLCGEQTTSDELMATGGEYVRLEGRFYHWFADGGKMLSERGTLGDQDGTRDSAWKAPDTVEDDPRYTVYLVTRDGRGGVAWSTLEVQVAEPE